MRKKEYPYQNISLKNISGERWKDIPGFEDQYQLSNYGRLKSQDRWVDYGKYDCFRPGRIKKLKQTGDPKSDLSMQLHKDGKRYRFSVARYVYHLFVNPFDTEDHSVIITRKDGDILNCYYKNLVLRSISEVAKEGFATNRRKSQFQLQVKPVTQYDPYGKQIATFKNAKQAAEATGVSPGYISSAAIAKERMAGGYYWRYGVAKPQINVLRFKKAVDTPPKSNIDFPHHHYLNRSLENIRDERWKAVKGFEGLYEISDHGRVKSLRHLKQFITSKGNNTQAWTREFIMKQVFTKSYNYYINKPLLHLSIGLNKEGHCSGYVVSRLVYQAFGKGTQSPDKKFIIHKDDDNFNNHISNLNPVSRTEIHQTSFAKNRNKSHFASLTPKQRREYTLRAIKVNKKPVIQYSLQNKRIAIFDSLVAAAKATGTYPSCISNAINGRYDTAGGFIWKKGTAEAVDSAKAAPLKLK